MAGRPVHQAVSLGRYAEGVATRLGALAPFGEVSALSLWYLAMNFSVLSRAMSSGTWLCGDFMRYELGPSSWPPMPLLSASLARRTASMTMPAEFGESHTSSLTSAVSGTPPNASPSRRMCAHLRSVSHGT